MQMPMESWAPDTMPSERSGSFSKQNTSFASVSGSMFGSWNGQIFRIMFRVDVDSPQRSRISKVGSREMVRAHPGAKHDTYGWSIHVPARSSRVGIWQGVCFSAVLERACSPSCGVRCSTTYSMPRSSHSRRFSSFPPSSLTTKTSGFTISSVGTKSMTPSPALMQASFT